MPRCMSPALVVCTDGQQSGLSVTSPVSVSGFGWVVLDLRSMFETPVGAQCTKAGCTCCGAGGVWGESELKGTNNYV